MGTTPALSTHCAGVWLLHSSTDNINPTDRCSLPRTALPAEQIPLSSPTAPTDTQRSASSVPTFSLNKMYFQFIKMVLQWKRPEASSIRNALWDLKQTRRETASTSYLHLILSLLKLPKTTRLAFVFRRLNPVFLKHKYKIALQYRDISSYIPSWSTLPEQESRSESNCRK